MAFLSFLTFTTRLVNISQAARNMGTAMTFFLETPLRRPFALNLLTLT